MEYDKMPQIQLRRIEKYVEEIKNKKIQKAYRKGRKLKAKDEEKINNCKEIKDFRINRQAFDLMEKKLRKKYKLCSINKKDIIYDFARIQRLSKPYFIANCKQQFMFFSVAITFAFIARLAHGSNPDV